MKKFLALVLVITITFLTWNAAAYACEAYDAETMQHTGNYNAASIIEWETVEEPVVEEHAVEETTVEEPVVEEHAVEETTVEETTVEEHTVEDVVTEEPTTTVDSSAKAEIKATEEKPEEIAPAGVSEKHFVQTGLLEDYRALEDKVIYLITALLIAVLAYMPFNRKIRKEK